MTRILHTEYYTAVLEYFLQCHYELKPFVFALHYPVSMQLCVKISPQHKQNKGRIKSPVEITDPQHCQHNNITSNLRYSLITMEFILLLFLTGSLGWICTTAYPAAPYVTPVSGNIILLPVLHQLSFLSGNKKSRSSLLHTCMLTFSKGFVQTAEFPWHNATSSLKICSRWSVVIVQISYRIKTLVTCLHRSHRL